MTGRALLVTGVIAVLIALNVVRYAGGGGTGDDRADGPISAVPDLPGFAFPTQASRSPPQAERDLFAFVEVRPEPVRPVPEPTVVAPVETGPDPREVALEVARVNMLNVHVTGVLSSRSGLSAMVNAPFFQGVAVSGTELGEGIVVEAVRPDRVRIAHPELALQRDISIE